VVDGSEFVDPLMFPIPLHGRKTTRGRWTGHCGLLGMCGYTLVLL